MYNHSTKHISTLEDIYITLPQCSPSLRKCIVRILYKYEAVCLNIDISFIESAILYNKCNVKI